MPVVYENKIRVPTDCYCSLLYIYYVYHSDCDVDIIPPHEGSKTNKQLYKQL